MNISDKNFEKLLEKNEKCNTLYLNNCQICKFNLHLYTYENIQFLSLYNNQLKHINFLSLFPNIWYLDLRKNYVENYEFLNKSSTFGYLGLTINKFSESSLFQLKRLNIGIFDIDGKIDDLLRFSLFLYNSNNNFMKVNKDVLLFSEKFKLFPNSINELLQNYSQGKVSKLY
jgi:hypothetical protein